MYDFKSLKYLFGNFNHWLAGGLNFDFTLLSLLPQTRKQPYRAYTKKSDIKIWRRSFSSLCLNRKVGARNMNAVRQSNLGSRYVEGGL